MKICIAQTKSIKGNIQKNIENHLRFVERAIQLKADIIVFPELSITNYEPQLAIEFATDVHDDVFNPFQKLSDENNIAIGVGMPTRMNQRIQISMLIFQAHKGREVNSKQHLHLDEEAYFVAGKEQVYINLKGFKMAFGICYESLQRKHFIKAIKNNVDIYIASVAKPQHGIDKTYKHFSSMSREFKTPILMSNAVGVCDNFISVGQSAIWNNNGKRIAQLDSDNQGLLIYNTQLKTALIEQLKIEKGKLSDLETVFKIYQNAKQDLERNGIFQWTDNYPTQSLIKSDIKKGCLYVLKTTN